MKKWYSYIITVNWFANVRIVTGAFLCGAMVSMAEVESELLCHGTSRTQQTNTAPFGEKYVDNGNVSECCLCVLIIPYRFHATYPQKNGRDT